MSFQLTRQGLELDVLTAGDIVTVKIRPHKRRLSIGLDATFEDESTNPQHYRHTTIFRILAVNGGQVVVERMTGHFKGEREVWAVSAHRWFEASELWEALTGASSEVEP